MGPTLTFLTVAAILFCAAMVAIAPWMIVREAWVKAARNDPAEAQPHPIAVLVALALCVMEVAMLIDYLFFGWRP